MIAPRRSVSIRRRRRAEAARAPWEAHGPAATAALRLVERELGAAQEPVGAVGIGRREGDADAEAGDDPLAVDLDRLAPRGDQALGQGLGFRLRREERDDDRERVAAEARQGVARAQGFLDAPGDDAQQLVADRVAEIVVDALQAVEVEAQHRRAGRRRARRPGGRGQGLAEPLPEQLAVGRPVSMS